MKRGLAAALVALLSGLALMAAPAAAKKRPIYRDPPSYKGIKKAPKTAPEPLPPAITLGNGTFPDVLVDEAGTAHIVFNDGRGDDSDAAVYCRLKRGATACDKTAVLTWEKTYGPGDSPQFNTDDLGPEIVRIGQQLVVLSKRYPTNSEKPDGTSSHTLIAWTSVNGGSDWTPNPAIVGKRNLGDPLAFGPEDDPMILSLAHDPFCGGMCATVLRSGSYSSDEGVLNTDPNSNYNGSLTLDNGVPVAAFSDLEPRIWLRRWNGTGAITDPGTWSTSAPFAGDEPWLASGPAGVFLLHRPGYTGPLQVRKLDPAAGNTLSPGPASAISAEREARFGRLEQDPTGRLHAAWSEPDGVKLRTSSSGSDGFGSAQRLIGGSANGQIELAATADGGGFAAFNHTGSVNSPGQIVATGFGNQAATGQPGLGSVPGGGALATQTCQEARFGSIKVRTASGCLLNGTGKSSHLIVSAGEVNLFGLRIVPDAGVRIVFDPKKLRIDTTGDVRVLLSNPAVGDILLWHGQIKRDLSAVKPGTNLFDFPIGKFKANVFGFDVGADIAVKVAGDGVRIPVSLKLPPAFGGFAGDAELRADPETGLTLESLKIHIGPVPLGALTIESIDLSYTSGDNWKGEGKLSVPAGGSLRAEVEFSSGDFAGAGFDYEPEPAPAIGPFVYLLSVGGSLKLDPDTLIEARASAGAGAAFRGEAPVKANGKFTMKFPKAGPASFDLRGSVQLFMIAVGDGHVRFMTDGYADFGGNTGLTLGPLSGSASVSGFVDAGSGAFGAQMAGDLDVCIEFAIEVCAGAGVSAAANNAGFAACGELDPPGLDPLTAGIGTRWDQINPLILYNPILLAAEVIDSILIPCSTAPYKTLAKPSQAGGGSVSIPAGLPTATIFVKGRDGRPQVTVTGPGGQTVSSAAPSDAGVVAGVEGADGAWVVLRRPQAGKWNVTANPGSPEITEVLLSEGYKPAEPRARVRRGRIDYRIKHLGAGQKVTFIESGRFGTNVIRTVARSQGAVRFKPASGRGGKRTVSALVERTDGLVSDRVKLGTYVAPPPPRPAKAKRVKAKRRGRTLAVTWKAPRGAAKTLVRVRGAKGLRLSEVVGGRKRRASFQGVRWAKKLRVEVTGVSKHHRRGKTARARVRGR